MKNNNASERLGRVLLQDKSAEPQKVLPALRSDIRDILREYGELKSDVKIEIEDTDDGYNVFMFASFNRIKL